MSHDGTIASSPKRQRYHPPPPALPEDLAIEILSMLPVESILKCKCVCKSWQSLSSSSAFINYHLYRSTDDLSLHRHRLLVRNDWEDYGGDHVSFRLSRSLRSLLDNPLSSPPLPPPLPIIRFLPHLDRRISPLVVGSCNGLICWVNLFDPHDHYFRYLNPSTRLQSMSPWFPYPLDSATMVGFGYDHLSDTYKTIGIWIYSHCDYDLLGNFILMKRIMVMVHTLGDDETSWREIPNYPSIPVTKMYGKLLSGSHKLIPDQKSCGKFVNGTLNWPCARPDRSLTILSLDITKETCEEISLPDQFVETYSQYAFPSIELWVLGGCLCFSDGASKDSFILWQMKVHGVNKQSWTLMLNIPYQDFLADFGFGFILTPFYMLDNGEVLFNIYNRVFLYNPRHKSFKYLKFQRYKVQFEGITHVESLVSPFPSRSTSTKTVKTC